jgi:hypothetical protein
MEAEGQMDYQIFNLEPDKVKCGFFSKPKFVEMIPRILHAEPLSGDEEIALIRLLIAKPDAIQGGYEAQCLKIFRIQEKYFNSGDVGVNEQLLFNLCMLNYALKAQLYKDAENTLRTISSLTNLINAKKEEDIFSLYRGLNVMESRIYQIHIGKIFANINLQKLHFSILSFPLLHACENPASSFFIRQRDKALELVEMERYEEARCIYFYLLSFGENIPSTLSHIVRLTLLEKEFSNAAYYLELLNPYLHQHTTPAYVKGRILFLSLLMNGLEYGKNSGQFFVLLNCICSFLVAKKGYACRWSLVEKLIETCEISGADDVLTEIAEILSGVKTPSQDELRGKMKSHGIVIGESVEVVYPLKVLW